VFCLLSTAEEIAKELEANEKTRTRLQGRAKPVCANNSLITWLFNFKGFQTTGHIFIHSILSEDTMILLMMILIHHMTA